MLSLVSMNLLNLYQGGQEQRYRQIEELIGGLDADIVAVQEIVASGAGKADAAAVGLRRFAAAVGRQCEVGGAAAVAVGGGQHHVGLLWRDGITPVVGTLAQFDRARAGMWHSLVTLVFELEGGRLRVGSVQLSPFDQEWGRRDAHQILRAMSGDAIPGLLAGDFNGVAGNPEYDPDPYAGVPWHPDHVYQLSDDGSVDRRVAVRLETIGRMRDCARLVGAPWQPTTGHYPGRHHPARRIDRWYGTYHLGPAVVRSYRVVDTSAARACSDHLPVVIEVDSAGVGALGVPEVGHV
jgi:endonuclease/exonuclease/phosphatase family metal-dependent hydrolase